MTVATISKEGLTTIAILVGGLWGCWVGQQYYLSQARQSISLAARDKWQLDRKTLPSATPRRSPAFLAAKNRTGVI